MLVSKGSESKYDPSELNKISADGKRTIVGYDLNFADWEGRYQRELSAGKILPIDNEISIDRRSIQSVQNSIYDKELGDLTDTDKDVREFSCDCGALYGKFYEGKMCNNCGTRVKSMFSMDIKRVGWIDVFPFYIINPNAYEIIGKTIGLKNLQKILQYDIQIDIDGNLTDEIQLPFDKMKKNKTVIPFANSGIIEFRKNFTQIISFYTANKNTSDGEYLIAHQNEIFSSKIPVSSVYLRPTFVSSKKRSVSFDKLNSIYIKMITDASLLKRTVRKEVDFKRSLNIVYDIQQSLQELYTETIKGKLSGKTKLIRGSVLGNRMNFSSRMVIRSFVGPHFGMDKVEMSYKGFLELHLLEIINALMRGYGDPSFTYMTVYEVIEYVQKSQYSNQIDPIIWKVMQTLLKARPWPVLVLRPPSLALGSLQYFEVSRIAPDASDKTLAIPLSSLSAQNADFDGDLKF